MGMKYLAKLEELSALPVLCDVDPYKNVKKYPFYCHFGEVKEDLKGVIVAVDPVHHVEIAESFLEEDIPVLLEKPPAPTSEEFRKIHTHPQLQVSEIELYSFPVKHLPKDIKPTSILIERLNKGRGYINPLWDLAWHDLYVLQYLFGDVEVFSVSEGKVWEMEGKVGGVPFKLRVAWEYEGGVVRRWTLNTDRREVILDFLREEIIIGDQVMRKKSGDKLREMVEDFLKGKNREGSSVRALKNLEILERVA